MIPILYEYNETNFDNFGICSLPDVINNDVLEGRDAQYELSINYPVSGAGFDEIAVERIIGVYANDKKTIQGFRIYDITKPLNGIVNILARHVSYDLEGYVCPVIDGAYTPTSLMQVLFAGTPFTGWSDIVTSKPVEQSIPVSVRSMLGGMEGSILDLFGGEYEFDNFTVKLHLHRGANNGVVVEYGKNITSLTDEYNIENVYTSILPYAVYYDEDGGENVVRGTKTNFTSVLSGNKTLIVDFSDKIAEDVVPTVAMLDALAASYIENNNLGDTASNMNVSFIPLWYDGGGDSIALCDTITVRHPKLGINKTVKVISTNYDFVRERFTKITCGKPTANFVSTVVDLQDDTEEAVSVLPEKMQKMAVNATRLITGNKGGYVIMHEGQDGKPFEFLIMDNPDINLAQNVWRWNLSGLGFSSHGYQGPFETAITSTGQINADFILTGQLIASIIKAGILSDLYGYNSWNLDTGVLNITKGKIQATFTQVYDHTDYSQTDIDIIDDYLYGTLTTLTDAQWEKYDLDGDEVITEDDYLRVQGMVGEQQDVTKTITTIIDPSARNRAITITTQLTAVGSVPAITHNSYYAGGTTRTETVKATQINFGKKTDVSDLTADELNEEIIVDGYPLVRPFLGANHDVDVTTGGWRHVAEVYVSPGVWQLTATARFNTNTTGRRQLCISDTAASSNSFNYGCLATVDAISDVRTSVHLSNVVSIGVGKFLYLNAYQNSGKTLDTLVHFSAVRLA